MTPERLASRWNEDQPTLHREASALTSRRAVPDLSNHRTGHSFRALAVLVAVHADLERGVVELPLHHNVVVVETSVALAVDGIR
jgi:hypothetical protein